MKRLAVLGALVLGLLIAPACRAAIGTATISGTVTAPVGVEEVEVCVVEAKPSETCTYPSPNGTYTLFGVGGGGQQIEFLPSYRSGLLVQYYDHKSSLSQATVIEVSNGPKAEVGQIDADLVLGGVIEGTVTGDGNTPLAEVRACAQEVGTGSVVGCSETDASGHYSVHSLPTGAYRVGFLAGGPSATYAPQFYAGKASLAEATPVAVSAGATHSGVDAQLAKGGRIEGTVSAAADGSELSGVSVCLFAAAAVKAARCAATDDKGAYTFIGLQSGSYRVGFSLEFDELAEGGEMPEDDGYRSQYYSGAFTLEEASALALSAPAGLNGIDAHLLPSREPAVPSPPPVLPPPLLAAPTISDTSTAEAKKCKRGYRRRVVKGEARCVKVHRHKRRHKRDR